MRPPPRKQRATNPSRFWDDYILSRCEGGCKFAIAVLVTQAAVHRMRTAKAYLALRRRGRAATVLRLLPALDNAMATACLIAFFLVDGWLAPSDPSFFQPPTKVLILLLTVVRLEPFLRGMAFLLSAKLMGRATHQLRRGNRIEIHPVAIAPFTMRLFNICGAFRLQGGDYTLFVQRIRNAHRQYDAAGTGFRLLLMISQSLQRTGQRSHIGARRRRGERDHRSAYCANRARSEPCGKRRAHCRLARTFRTGIHCHVATAGNGIVLTRRIVVKNADISSVNVVRHQCRHSVRAVFRLKSPCNDPFH